MRIKLQEPLVRRIYVTVYMCSSMLSLKLMLLKGKYCKHRDGYIKVSPTRDENNGKF